MQVEELNGNQESSIAELGRILREIAYQIQVGSSPRVTPHHAMPLTKPPSQAP